MTKTINDRSRGFTLTELAVVMVIVAIMLGGLMMPLSTQRDLQSNRDTQKQLADISEALLGYAAAHETTTTPKNPYLPCPDTDNDGFENRGSAGGCTAVEGRLPWGDLGIGREDAWGNHFRYRVDKNYADRATGFKLNQIGTLSVCEESTCAKVLVKELPVVIVSHGKNGAGAFNTQGGTNAAPSSTDEIANQDADNSFVQRTSTSDAASEFDDIVVWISPYVLINRMLTAGKWP